MAHAGAVHMDTTEEFESIYDDYARDKLKGHSQGKVYNRTVLDREEDGTFDLLVKTYFPMEISRADYEQYFGLSSGRGRDRRQGSIGRDPLPKGIVIDGNNSENDVLLEGELEYLSKMHKNQIEMDQVLSHPGESWTGLKGQVNEDIMKRHAFEPGNRSVALLYSPPAMIQKAVLPALLAYDEDKNLFDF
ncbi:hypothetical protein BDV32DRAFT_145408 [Aspergillus pseudonomiae]|uniref:Oxidoreductase FAD/NAD(P)-binding domain-containing protein n=1 Tax=Aspergillus pseudonomiae TaxID=1506151 RepID=A0A5N6IDB7_9EURO|nr:uncharacterized protein BDV37DRAFT_285286 [Aspergillus pseudonomiae]KAB8264731.1 hypothetical protein BDV32DRAFT_145408 [Aspergillus pseudonomiae]KAE8401883.1 hypothetical protein BDV37DRAFT_285286 [Aspergillus pseudonomiae]